MDQALKKDILALCRKVTEVVTNNDWPTTEGSREEEDVPSEMENLVNRIHKGVSSL